MTNHKKQETWRDSHKLKKLGDLITKCYYGVLNWILEHKGDIKGKTGEGHHLIEQATLDLGVMSSSPTLGIEPT